MAWIEHKNLIITTEIIVETPLKRACVTLLHCSKGTSLAIIIYTFFCVLPSFPLLFWISVLLCLPSPLYLFLCRHPYMRFLVSGKPQCRVVVVLVHNWGWGGRAPINSDWWLIKIIKEPKLYWKEETYFSEHPVLCGYVATPMQWCRPLIIV